MRPSTAPRSTTRAGRNLTTRSIRFVRELAPVLRRWQAPHRQWSEGEPWDPNVSSYAMDDGERLLLLDPIGGPFELADLARALA